MECYECQHTIKLSNLDEMGEFLERCKLPSLTDIEVEKLDKPITSKEFELVINNFFKKIQVPDGFTF